MLRVRFRFVVACCIVCDSARRSVSVSAAADKHQAYGTVAPHVFLPFVVEHAGALGKEADDFFKGLRRRVGNTLPEDAYDESSWSCRTWSNFYFQKLSVANLKGLGHHFMVAAAKLRVAGGVPFT